MYKAFYGLQRKPFGLHPDPDYIYMSEEHARIYSHLLYAIAENKGFVVVTGEIGSGKTTLVNHLMGKIRQQIHVGLINRTDVTPIQFIKMICQEFELEVAGMDKADMQEKLDDFLIAEFAAKRRVVLIIDEAQNLPEKTMEEIRMLSNLESEKHRLIQVILVGQPELKSKLRKKRLEQFAQRVTVYCHLHELSKRDTLRYIRYRMKVAGAKNLELFDQEAIVEIISFSRGIPRLINILCDTALVYGYADGREVIDREIIREVVRDRKEVTSDHRPRGKRKTLTLSGPVKERFRNLERRIGIIETQLNHLAGQLTALGEMRNERDEIVVELLRMLRVDMEARKGMPQEPVGSKGALKNQMGGKLQAELSSRLLSLQGRKRRGK